MRSKNYIVRVVKGVVPSEGKQQGCGVGEVVSVEVSIVWLGRRDAWARAHRARATRQPFAQRGLGGRDSALQEKL